ncbi:mast/stem cell growth factor receptor Kit-like [Megalopta genalis]|uniref:mast/stem cell growth factor receptor Kit-like n=1 Tax=Megalopta genalis TaxID=115081 RepID=UPI003FCF9F9D
MASGWHLPYVEKLIKMLDQRRKHLGSGAFGVVLKAEALGICDGEAVTTVAVKMIRRAPNLMYISALASELKIMVHLGKHLNVVNLFGACTKNILKRELLVIVEFCRFGNLHNYLLRYRNSFINQINPATGKLDLSIDLDLSTRLAYLRSINRLANGIVLWEFLALAETPYLRMEAETVYQKLIEGYRLEQYDIMCQCWKAKPSLRPSFTELIDSVGKLLEDNVRAMSYAVHHTLYKVNALFS